MGNTPVMKEKLNVIDTEALKQVMGKKPWQEPWEEF
jgi:hypothetical protein